MNGYNPPPAFRGFSAEAFAFLKDLADNQNREWFEAHKPIYEREVKEPLAGLVVSLGQALAAKNIDFCCDPKRAIFRIHKDVRFSKDKKPYKTNAGATLTRDGERRSPGVLYIHVDPEGSFAAGGFYRPEPPQLHAIRRRIMARPEDIKAILGSLEASGLRLEQDDILKRTPSGFEAVEPPELGALLRLKSLIVRRALSRKLLADGDALIVELVDFADLVHPVLRFGWAAIS